MRRILSRVIKSFSFEVEYVLELIDKGSNFQECRDGTPQCQPVTKDQCKQVAEAVAPIGGFAMQKDVVNNTVTLKFPMYGLSYTFSVSSF